MDEFVSHGISGIAQSPLAVCTSRLAWSRFPGVAVGSVLCVYCVDELGGH